MIPIGYILEAAVAFAASLQIGMVFGSLNALGAAGSETNLTSPTPWDGIRERKLVLGISAAVLVCSWTLIYGIVTVRVPTEPVWWWAGMVLLAAANVCQFRFMALMFCAKDDLIGRIVALRYVVVLGATALLLSGVGLKMIASASSRV